LIHCDWPGLLTAIKETEAEKIICTHGYTDIFSKYLRTLGYDASPLAPKGGTVELGNEEVAETEVKNSDATS